MSSVSRPLRPLPDDAVHRPHPTKDLRGLGVGRRELAGPYLQGVHVLDGRTGPGTGSLQPVLVHVGERGRTRPTPLLDVDRGRLDPHEVVERSGLLVMAATPACVSIACRYGAEEGLVAADAALAAGLTTRQALLEHVARHPGRRGVPRPQDRSLPTRSSLALDVGVLGADDHLAAATMGAMTELLSRPPGPRGPRRPPPGPPVRPISVTVAGVVAALQAAGLGVLAVMVVVLVGWATAADSAASAMTAVTGGLQVWLVSHHTRLVLPGGEFSLTPLALSALPLVLLHSAALRAGRLAQVRGRRGVIALTSAVTASYAVLATGVALLARTDAVAPVPSSAFLGAAAFAALAAGSAAVRATGRWLVLWHRLPLTLRTALPPAAAALAVLLGSGALLVAAMLTRHHAAAEHLVAGLDPGAGGTLLLLLGSLLYVPDAVVWGTAFVTGPGFAVGQGTSVTVAGADLGAVPAFPLLAALPGGTGAGAGLLTMVAPLLAGVLVAFLLRRGCEQVRQVVEMCGLVGALVGLGTGALALLSAGSAGPGRMADVGPDWWAVGLASGLEVATAAGVTLLLLLRRRVPAGDPRPDELPS